MTDLSQLPASVKGRSLLPSPEQRERLRRKRAFRDGASRYGIGAAGIGVVFALGMIFVYLFSEIMPLFKPAQVSTVQSYATPGVESDETLEHLTIDRHDTLGASFTDTGRITFFELEDGSPRTAFEVPRPEAAQTTAFATGFATTRSFAYGYDSGELSLGQIEYAITYPDNLRHIEPELTFPLGESPLTLDEEGRAIQVLGLQVSDRGIYAAAELDDGTLLVSSFERRENIMTGEVSVEQTTVELPGFDGRARQILIDNRFRHLYVSDDTGNIHHYDIGNLSNPDYRGAVQVSGNGYVTEMALLNGTVSLVAGTSDGQVRQYFPVRDDHNRHELTHIRDFARYDAPITHIEAEYARRGFLVGDARGNLGIHHATASADVFDAQMVQGPFSGIAISPVNSMALLVDENQQLQVASVSNRHPDISFSSLWQRVWYEGSSQPRFVWQSSAGGDEFEPKMSLVPLTLGTLKAAFYAMLFATPLALMGAIYTAYFMSPKLRGKVKPTIEVMEALPTVILGFLAGLWLAPFIENRLPAVFSILLLMPIAMLAFAYLWSRLPEGLRTRVPDGWEAVLLMPVIILVGWACVSASPYVEILFFDGSLRQWLTDTGISYDQRNALVVGIAMGFAVIPTIFSIAEDAVFNVPKHLTQGSLALGATRWQTVVGVVLPTASIGMFSAVMMGFGRAVGETMIVLMATGNSPIMNFNIFEGMRTLSANIAVELTESAVGSSHFRVLFLAALVLLAMTFVVNTLAEIIRQRLRKRYGNL
ncbi:ABC transporter permease subunit [Billgrantia kenyensis]|uniref:ABC transporter permease subunit n=1 Tax=Billgrantia kenyensis TaxID=321266 RepID=A0A7W0ADL7_9GAMM|nr:ABC transporter permease subunit [Halomonas kenyensis]MBA2778645.1 ABC transporter permease subunit [Halomonas kenyensis]MCG6661550.1 ABC transporter permease subunit [Halomonas kenyensis]